MLIGTDDLPALLVQWRRDQHDIAVAEGWFEHGEGEHARTHICERSRALTFSSGWAPARSPIWPVAHSIAANTLRSKWTSTSGCCLSAVRPGMRSAR